MNRATFVIVCKDIRYVEFLINTAWNKVASSMVLPGESVHSFVQFNGVRSIVANDFQIIFATPSNQETLLGLEITDFRSYPDDYSIEPGFYDFLQSRVRGVALAPTVEEGHRWIEIENGIEMLCTTKYGS